MTIDWGIANNLLALSGGRMELTEASYAFEGAAITAQRVST